MRCATWALPAALIGAAIPASAQTTITRTYDFIGAPPGDNPYLGVAPHGGRGLISIRAEYAVTERGFFGLSYFGDDAPDGDVTYSGYARTTDDDPYVDLGGASLRIPIGQQRYDFAGSFDAGSSFQDSFFFAFTRSGDAVLTDPQVLANVAYGPDVSLYHISPLDYFFQSNASYDRYDLAGYFTSRDQHLRLTYVFAEDGVPEPAQWALMVIGFGAMGALRRKAGPMWDARSR